MVISQSAKFLFHAYLVNLGNNILCEVGFCFVNLAANLVDIEEAVSLHVSCSLDLVAKIGGIMKVEL